MGVAVCCHWTSHSFVCKYLHVGDMQARIVMRTIGVASVTHLIEIKKCSHQAVLSKLCIRTRHDWERVEQNNVKLEDNLLACFSLWCFVVGTRGEETERGKQDSGGKVMTVC